MKWSTLIGQAQTVEELRDIAGQLLSALSPGASMSNCGRWEPQMLPLCEVYDSEGVRLWEGKAEHAQAVYDALNDQPGSGYLVVVIATGDGKGIVIWPDREAGRVHGMPGEGR